VAIKLQEAAGDLEDTVVDLVDANVLKRGQGQALTSKLEAAIHQLDRGMNRAAGNQLGAFINQVRAIVRARVLTEQEGQALIDEAERMRTLLT